MKQAYCANCGMQLQITRKALPKYGRIVDLVRYHECLHVPLELDLKPDPVPVFVETPNKNKFEQNLIELSGPDETIDLRDRRSKEHVIDSTAPASLLDQLKARKGTG